MSTMPLYALLVGVDAYLPPVAPLRGARRDVLDVEQYLRARIPEEDLHLLTLTDAEATRAAVIAGFRKHLGQAGPGDSVLFWFSGRGSWLPAPAELAHLDPTGRFQTLLCSDSRLGPVPDLLDCEVALLVADIAAAGAHVALVLDRCHGDGAAPEDVAAAAAVAGAGADFEPEVRWSPPPTVPPSSESFLTELQDMIGAESAGAEVFSAADHVALAACGPREVAVELRIGEHHRGVFTSALLDRLTREPTVTYRRLLDDARSRVRHLVPGQGPTLFPAGAARGGALADQPFLGGPPRVPPSSMRIRYRDGAWILDAGACHGLVPGTAADPTVVTVRGSGQARPARVAEVRAEQSVLEPIGWEPDGLDRRTSHPVVVTRVPLPAETVGLETASAGAYIRPLLVRTLASAGAGGVPSPYLRVVDGADRACPPTLRLRAAGAGLVRVCRADGAALAPPYPCRSPEQAARLVGDLEHIARWRLFAGLANPVSPLARAVRLEVAAVRRGQTVDRLGQPPLASPEDGSLVVNYHRAPDGSVQAPSMFLRIRNTSDRALYCVVLHLTDRFRMDTDLFAGDWVGARRTVSAGRGRAVRIALPPGRAAVPGASATEWFKVLISETPLNAVEFSLPRLGEPAASALVTSAAAAGTVGSGRSG
ncbi:MAG: caspase family protein, partial [Catenulispora sp.]|nr:caspase family protein [Catenulispora sp.]